ncbi:MAG: hypothetical protein P4L59_20205 [Desulfosporosinus sp.]|nr:hypothetical protein [Desulfosporosinus sp.]
MSEKYNNVTAVYGDNIRDVMFSSDGPEAEAFSWRTTKPSEQDSGAKLLYELLAELDENNSTIDHSNKTYNFQSINEWNSKDKKTYYLKKQLCFFDVEDLSEAAKEIKETDTDIDIIRDTNIFAVFNMSDSIYWSDSFGRKVKEKIINSQEESNILIFLRSIYKDNEMSTKFAEKFMLDEILASRTILILNVNDLRTGSFEIREGMSWEQMANETYRCLLKIHKKMPYKKIIVSFNHEGCLIFDGEGSEKTGEDAEDKNHKHCLFYYPGEIVGDFVKINKKDVTCKVTTMMAAIIWEIKNCGYSEENLHTGVRKGLELMRHQIEIGFKAKDNKFFGYPLDEIVQRIRDESIISSICSKIIECPQITTELLTQTFLEDVVSMNMHNGELLIDGALKVCKEIVTFGVHSAANKKFLGKEIPFLRFNKLIVYDKEEIEKFREIYNILKLYVKNKGNKPLSIGVFGKPGSGKSFGVKQLVRIIEANSVILEFNLSQMRNINELTAAFHQIRDASIRGTLPIVFWDEFDSSYDAVDFGWLKYFLAPMQDGTFLENMIEHTIGRAVFVFAGGISSSMEEFSTEAKKEKYKTNKLNDFSSRLRGYINIGSVNPSDYNYKEGGKTKEDLCYMFRRAVLIRSILEQKLHINEEQEILIKNDTLIALLKEYEYINGARSIEALLQRIDVTFDKYINDSNLPNEEDLKLYIKVPSIGQ